MMLVGVIHLFLCVLFYLFLGSHEFSLCSKTMSTLKDEMTFFKRAGGAVKIAALIDRNHEHDDRWKKSGVPKYLETLMTTTPSQRRNFNQNFGAGLRKRMKSRMTDRSALA